MASSGKHSLRCINSLEAQLCSNEIFTCNINKHIYPFIFSNSFRWKYEMTTFHSDGSSQQDLMGQKQDIFWVQKWFFFQKIFSNLLKCDGFSKHILLWWLWYLIATISYNWCQGNRTWERMELFPFNCWRITPEIIWWGSILTWSALINIFSIPVTNNSLCVCFLNLKIFKSRKIFLIKVLFFIFSWTWIKMLRVKSKEREELIVQTLWGHLFPWTHFAK